MKIHLDKDSFYTSIKNIHERSGYRMDIIEKDYYVTMILKLDLYD